MPGIFKAILPYVVRQSDVDNGTVSAAGLPQAGKVVELFNSSTAFGAKCLQSISRADWFVYSIAPSTNATGNSVTGQWSADGGVTWNEFYASASNEPVGDSTTFTDEVPIAQFQDVRFRFNNGASAQATKFDVAMALDAGERASSGI